MQKEDFNNTPVITLYTSNNSLQNRLLASFISEKLNQQCAVVDKTHNIPTTTQLLLINCSELSVETLHPYFLDYESKEKTMHIGLFNVYNDSEHEKLLSYSCINGLFYIETRKEKFLKGINELLLGEYWIPRKLLHNVFNHNRMNASKVSNEKSYASSFKLTPREKEILNLIDNGATNITIATTLGLSEHTIKSHLYNLYRKIDVKNRKEAKSWLQKTSVEKDSTIK